MARTPTEKRYAKKVVRHLTKGYPDAECALNFDSPFQLLIATILSAQCTDVRVNIVTKQLFSQYPTAKELAQVAIEDLEGISEDDRVSSATRRKTSMSVADSW